MSENLNIALDIKCPKCSSNESSYLFCKNCTTYYCMNCNINYYVENEKVIENKMHIHCNPHYNQDDCNQDDLSSIDLSDYDE